MGGLAALSLMVCSIAVEGHGEEVVYRRMDGNANIEVGARTWISQGRTTWHHDASSVSSLLGNPTSKLDYQDLWSHVVELSGSLVHRKGFSFRGQAGYGRITDGLLVDDDFLSPSGAVFWGASQGGEHRFSRTHSDIDGSYLLYFNADLGLLFWSFAEGRGGIHGTLGFQYWREKYEARSVRQIECTVVGVLCNAAGTSSNVGELAITNTVVWRSIRVGAEGQFDLTDWLGVEGQALFLPLAWLENEDVHHLRTDLQQDPSFSMDGLGYGFNLEGLVKIKVFERMYLHGGYRYWWLRVADGDWQNHPIASASSTVNLNEFRTFRHGAIAGLTYEF